MKGAFILLFDIKEVVLMVIVMRRGASIDMVRSVASALSQKGFNILIRDINSQITVAGVGAGLTLTFFEGEALRGVKEIHEDNKIFVQDFENFVEGWQFFTNRKICNAC
jgi:hypothetical protein